MLDCDCSLILIHGPMLFFFHSNLMAQDINEAEKGGVWPLSCYNFWPAISTGNVPGLEDISPDEMRHMQLQAQLSGNMEACVSTTILLLDTFPFYIVFSSSLHRYSVFTESTNSTTISTSQGKV